MDSSNSTLTTTVSDTPPVLKAHALGSSRYDPLIEKLDAMSVGEHFELRLPKDAKICATFQSRISAGLAPRLRAKGKAYGVKIRQLADDSGLAVFKTELSAPVAKAAPAKAPKASKRPRPKGKAVRAAKKAKKPTKR